MDSLFTCFVAHLSLTLCYGLCNQQMHYLWSSIGLFSKKRVILVRGLSLSLLNGCHVCFPWSFLKVNLEHHIWRIKHQMFSCLLTHNLFLHRPIFESEQVVGPMIQSWLLCLCILHCEMLYKNASIPVSRHEDWVAFLLVFWEHQSYTKDSSLLYFVFVDHDSGLPDMIYPLTVFCERGRIIIVSCPKVFKVPVPPSSFDNFV